MGISNENQNRTFQDNSMYMETTPAPVQVCFQDRPPLLQASGRSRLWINKILNEMKFQLGSESQSNNEDDFGTGFDLEDDISIGMDAQDYMNR